MMKNEQLVSIVVLLYNSEKYLKECLDSVIEQTYENIEIITVINGNCKDNTEAIVKEYAEKDKRIIIIKNHENSIITEGLKLGFGAMTGTYFTLLEGDDYFDKKAIENLVCNMIDDIDIVTGQIVMIDQEKKTIKMVSRPDFDIMSSTDFLKIFYPYMDYLTHGKLFKTSLYKNIQLPPAFIGHDMLLVSQLLLNAKTIKNITQTVHFFRRHSNAITNSHSVPFSRLETSFICSLTMRDIFVRKQYCNDLEVKRVFETDMLRGLASCLISGKGSFYKKYKQDVVKLLNSDALNNKKSREYLKSWRGVLFVLDIYKKMPILANIIIYGIDFIRKILLWIKKCL